MPFTAQHIKSARLHLQKSDPVMKRLLKLHGPFTAKARMDRFGTLVDSIISQQISTAAADTIIARLKQAVAERADSQRASSSTPRAIELTAERVRMFDIEELRELGVSRQKGTYLLDLAEKVHDGTVDLKNLPRKSDEEVIETLTQVKGIGRWTAQMFLMFSLARLDVLPVDDLGLKNAVQRQYGLAELPRPAQMEEIAAPWRPYATVASWYLWRSLK